MQRKILISPYLQKQSINLPNSSDKLPDSSLALSSLSLSVPLFAGGTVSAHTLTHQLTSHIGTHTFPVASPVQDLNIGLLKRGEEASQKVPLPTFLVHSVLFNRLPVRYL